jgi:hypothetical protein
VPRLTRFALAFSVSCEVISISAHNGVRSCLECLTADRWLGQGWRMDGFRSRFSASFFLAKDPKEGV